MNPNVKMTLPTGWLRLAALLWLVADSAHAQPYALDSGRITAGGGTSAGGSYAVTGAIAQPEAGGAMVGGTYAVTGGLLAPPLAVQSPGAPKLVIVRAAAPGQVTLSWSPATLGYVLQQSPGLAPTAWANSPSGATNPVTVPVTLAIRFYRLTKP